MQASLGDTQNARGTLLGLAGQDSPFAWGAAVVSFVVGVGFFLTVWILAGGNFLGVNKSSLDTSQNKDLLYTLIGTVASSFATMVSFWLGSSQSSRRKDDTLRQLSLAHAATSSHLADRLSGDTPGGDDTLRAGDDASGSPSNGSPLIQARATERFSDGTSATATAKIDTSTPPATPADSNFDACLSVLLQVEGGLTDDLHDPGGLTNLGIIKSDLAQFRRVPESSITDADIRNLQRDEARLIYHALYWNAMSCGDLPRGVDLMVFQFGVLAGAVTSVRVLQDVVLTKVDGLIGPVTLEAVKRFPPQSLIVKLQGAQLTHLSGLKNWTDFRKGWTNRINISSQDAVSMSGWSRGSRTT